MGKRRKYDSDLPKKEYRKLYLELEGYNSREKKMELAERARRRYWSDEAFRQRKREYARNRFGKIHGKQQKDDLIN